MDLERAAKQASQAGAAMGGQCEAAQVREKRWDECGLEEKVERLRMVLRSVHHDTEAAGKVAHKAYEIAHLHEHGDNGRPVMPIAIDPWGNPANQIIHNDSYAVRRIRLLD